MVPLQLNSLGPRRYESRVDIKGFMTSKCYLLWFRSYHRWCQVFEPHYPLVIQHSYGKSQFFMGKLIISLAILNSYVELPEGKCHSKSHSTTIFVWFSYGFPWSWSSGLTKATRLLGGAQNLKCCLYFSWPSVRFNTRLWRTCAWEVWHRL